MQTLSNVDSPAPLPAPINGEKDSPAHLTAKINGEESALLLFCKPPLPGLVKTRLTKERGGKLSAEEAAEFFRCSLLDLTELALLALSELREAKAAKDDQGRGAATGRGYDFFISTTSPESIAALKQMFAADGCIQGEINYLIDRGASFNEHFGDAFAQLFERGYEQVVAIGGDMPTLPREHILDAFLWLDFLAAQNPQGQAVVLAPCQQSGVSLVGQTRSTPIDSQGVYYNLNGLPALDAYAQKIADRRIPCAYLNPVSDVDEDHDLAHCISCLNAIAEASRYQPGLYLPGRVLDWIDRLWLKASAPANENHDPRDLIDV